MPRRGAVALVTTVLAVALLFSFQPAEPSDAQGLPKTIVPGPVAAVPNPTSAQATPTTSPSFAALLTATPTPALTPSPQPSEAANTAARTIDGDAYNTPYGTVQIALVVQGGQIVDVQELQMPYDRRLSAQISAEAGPLLKNQVLRAQSANINGVSGASYTSYGFWESLQSALAQM